MRLTQKQLNLWLAKWQAMLRLQDWDITAELQDRKEMDGADGLCGPTAARRHAVIYIAKNAGCPKNIVPHDPERTLVHELLHVLFSPFELQESESPSGIAQEQVVDQMATLLLRLERATKLQ